MCIAEDDGVAVDLFIGIDAFLLSISVFSDLIGGGIGADIIVEALSATIAVVAGGGGGDDGVIVTWIPLTKPQ